MPYSILPLRNFRRLLDFLTMNRLFILGFSRERA
jgi:hypothetical protein